MRREGAFNVRSGAGIKRKESSRTVPRFTGVARAGGVLDAPFVGDGRAPLAVEATAINRTSRNAEVSESGFNFINAV